MTLYDPDDSRHDAITPQERAAISAWLASNQPKICPPCTFTPEPEKPTTMCRVQPAATRAAKTQAARTNYQRINEMFDAGESPARIAEVLAISPRIVRGILRGKMAERVPVESITPAPSAAALYRQILALHDEGIDATAIARCLEVALNRVTKHISKHRPDAVLGPLTAAEMEAQGMDRGEIAARLGITRKAVHGRIGRARKAA